MQLTDSRIEKLSEKLKIDIPEIKFAYLFGSSVTGKSRENSDVDIGIYLNAGTKSFELISRILTSIEDIIPEFQIDLTVLNDAGVIISMEALKGKLLFVREHSEDFHAGFYTLTCRKYEDHMVWMKKQLKYRGHEVYWDD